MRGFQSCKGSFSASAARDTVPPRCILLLREFQPFQRAAALAPARRADRQRGAGAGGCTPFPGQPALHWIRPIPSSGSGVAIPPDARADTGQQFGAGAAFDDPVAYLEHFRAGETCQQMPTGDRPFPSRTARSAWRHSRAAFTGAASARYPCSMPRSMPRSMPCASHSASHSLARASRNVVISFLSGCASASNGGNADRPRVRCDHSSLAHACSALRNAAFRTPGNRNHFLVQPRQQVRCRPRALQPGPSPTRGCPPATGFPPHRRPVPHRRQGPVRTGSRE